MAKEANKLRRDLSIMWSSNSHFSFSGYGVFTRDLLFRLRDDGWKPKELAFWGLQGHQANIDGIEVYPVMGDPYGSDALLNHSIDTGVNVAFTMQDVWSIQPEALTELKQKGIPWIPYLPIDTTPVPDAILQRLNLAYKIITFSKFGQKCLEDQGYASKLIVEGIDTNIFKPLNNKQELRTKFNLPQDMFLFSMIAANKENPPRKGFQEALEAFKLFHDNHPNSGIFFHTQQTAPGGFPIQDYARHLGVDKSCFYMNPYAATFKADSELVNEEINSVDCVLHPSQTEGFGLGVIEGQACGKPVIIQDCTSMPELIIEGKTGWACKTQKKFWRTGGGYVFMADVNSLHEKMEEVFLSDKEKVAIDARKNVVDNYNIDTIFKESWVPFMESLQEELLPVVDKK